MSQKILLRLAFIFPAALALLSWRAVAAGTSSAAFLRVGWGARPAAMGDAFTAVADDVDALYWNPAGLNYVKRLEQTFGHNAWIEDLNLEHASFALRHSTAVVIGAGIGFLNAGDIERGDKYGNAVGYYSANDLALLFSYARRLKKIYAGASFKVVRERIEDASAQAFGLDAGAVYEVSPKLKLGATIRNLGTGLTLAKTPGSLPMGLRAGAALQFSKNLLLASDISLPFDDSLSLHLGGEYLYPSPVKGVRLTLRAGVKTSAMSYLGAVSALSLGFGAQSGAVGVDYALSPYGDLGMTHRISLKIKFSGLSGADGEIVVEKDGKKTTRTVETVYRETLQWFGEKAEKEKLDGAQQLLILDKIREKFESLGVDVSALKEKISGLKK